MLLKDNLENYFSHPEISELTINFLGVGLVCSFSQHHVYPVYNYKHNTSRKILIILFDGHLSSSSSPCHAASTDLPDLLPPPVSIIPWCNDYRRRIWTRRHEFKSSTWLIAFHIALIPLGKVWIQLFSLQLWVNSRAD